MTHSPTLLVAITTPVVSFDELMPTSVVMMTNHQQRQLEYLVFDYLLTMILILIDCDMIVSWMTMKPASFWSTCFDVAVVQKCDDRHRRRAFLKLASFSFTRFCVAVVQNYDDRHRWRA